MLLSYKFGRMWFFFRWVAWPFLGGAHPTRVPCVWPVSLHSDTKQQHTSVVVPSEKGGRWLQNLSVLLNQIRTNLRACDPVWPRVLRVWEGKQRRATEEPLTTMRSSGEDKYVEREKMTECHYRERECVFVCVCVCKCVCVWSLTGLWLFCMVLFVLPLPSLCPGVVHQHHWHTP